MSAERLRVDWTKCDGHGLCHEILPEYVALDDWRYPMLRPDAVPPPLLPLAKRAVAACPMLALSLERVPENGRRVPAPSPGQRPLRRS
ncbi:MAG: ferredoxin [Candidatus Dormiibacterota bacterium]